MRFVPLRHAVGLPPPGGQGNRIGLRGWGPIGLFIRFVTPDLFRGPPRRKKNASNQALLLAAEWTPEQVRGDGVGVEVDARMCAIALPEKKSGSSAG